MTEEPLVSCAEAVEPDFAIGRAAEPVLRALAMACEAPFALPAMAGEPCRLVRAELPLRRTLNYADRAALSAVLPAVRTEFAASDAALGLLGSAFLWTYALGSPFAGWLADRTSRARIVVASLAAWSVATAAVGLANGLPMLLALRIALGVAECLYLPAAVALIADYHGSATRGRALSLLLLGVNGGMVFGGSFSGYMADHTGWRSGFWVLGLGGVALALLARPMLPRAPMSSATGGGGTNTLPMKPKRDAEFRWHGRVAIVTGASSGIGAAIAAMLGELGLKVALVGRDRARLRGSAVNVRRAGGEPLTVACELTRPDAIARVFGRVARKWGRVDVLVNCAATHGGRTLLGADASEQRAALELNIAVPLATMRLACAQFRCGREGAVINVASLAAHRVPPGTPPMYAATKHALRIVTDALRAEVAARRLPIKVALVSPGLVDTPWHSQLPHAALTARDVADAVRTILVAPPHVQVCDILLRPHGQGY